MGLDMYLRKRHYVKNWDHHPEEEHYEIDVKKGGETAEEIDTKKVSHIVEDVAYWRKFNALHGWFVENCQGGEDDCGEHYVRIEKLRQLLDLLKAVLDNPEKAEQSLPVTAGFFFGSYEYDEWYFDYVKETIEILEKELSIENNNASYYYTSSW